MQLWSLIELFISVLIASIYLFFVLLAQSLIWLSGLVAEVFQFLFATWIVQGAFAAWVAFELQQIQQENANRVRRIEKQYDLKVQTIGTLFSLVDKRIVATADYRGALQAEDGDWLAERQEYRKVVKEWNERATHLVVTMLTLLPAPYCYKFDNEIFHRFAQIDELLGMQRQLVERGAGPSFQIANEVSRLMNEVSKIGHGLLADFMNIAREDRARIEQKPNISRARYEEIRLRFLVSALFIPSKDR